MYESNYKKAGWPVNLVMDLNNGLPYGDPIDIEHLPTDFLPTLEYLLTKRSQEYTRSVAILRNRYENQMSYDDIGKLYGVTRERIRQVVAKELRALRIPQRWKILQPGWLQHLTDEKITAHSAGYKEGFEQGVIEGQTGTKQTEEPTTPPYSMPLEQLDLSVRSYNILLRAGCRTCGDVLKMNYTQLTHLRNLGKRSYEDILRNLEHQGFDCSRLLPSGADT